MTQPKVCLTAGHDYHVIATSNSSEINPEKPNVQYVLYSYALYCTKCGDVKAVDPS